MAPQTLFVNGHELDQETQQEGGSHFTPDASDSNYILVACSEPLKFSQEHELQAQGAQILKFHPPAAYVCKYRPTDLEPVRSLPFVVTANVYNQSLVINPSLKTPTIRALGVSGAATDSPQHLVHIILHPSAEGDLSTLREELARLVGVDKDQIVRDGRHYLRAKLRQQDLAVIAAHDEVQSIEPIGEDRYLNHVCRNDLNITEQSWFFQRRFGRGHREATGEVIAITDSGFDLGLTTNMHRAFGTGSVLQVRPIGPVADGGDRSGHGTHCAGSIVGHSWSPFGTLRGTAPGASLVVQSLSSNIGTVLNDPTVSFDRIFLDPFEADDTAPNKPRAFIHSISWNDAFEGGPRQGYSTKARIVDEEVFHNRELLIVQGAGNDGVRVKEDQATVTARGERPSPHDANAIDGKATAKNILTVGACESTRPLREFYSPYVLVFELPLEQQLMNQERDPYVYVPTTAPQRMVGEQRFVGDTGQVAWFSSCGPTVPPPGSVRARFKPDLIAPGMSICSAKSRHPELNIVKKTEGHPQYDWFGEAPNTDWFFLSGTSHSAPLAAGCAAIIRKALREKYHVPITASAIKAVLINNTRDLTIRGGNVRGPVVQPAPDGAQGHGLLDVSAALRNIIDGVNGFVEPQGAQLNAPTVAVPVDVRRYPVTIRAQVNPVTLTVTLVWADFPDPILVNELALQVEHANGTYMWGNDNTLYPGGGGAAGARDDKNNVQKVVWRNIPPGQVHVRVECHAIPARAGNLATQDFSLAYYVQY